METSTVFLLLLILALSLALLRRRNTGGGSGVSPKTSSIPCFYCDRYKTSQPDYLAQNAAYDLGSHAPRCWRHWRFTCSNCHLPKHFAALAFCPTAQRLFCSTCSNSKAQKVVCEFAGLLEYDRFQSPWSRDYVDNLGRLDYVAGGNLNQHIESVLRRALSSESFLVRYPSTPNVKQPARVRPRSDAKEDGGGTDGFTEEDSRANWSANADIWDANYDEDGDINRRYQSDEPMLRLLGDVAGKSVLDVGSGGGYLCRKLAKQGAKMTGVENADRFYEIAQRHEKELKQATGTVYHRASACDMSFLASGSFDKAVSNYVLMDIADYQAVVREVFRVLKPGGRFVAVISHPCFSCGPGNCWLLPAPDSPNVDERAGMIVDQYFRRCALFTQWGELKPVLGFHRPLRDYWATFKEAGFAVLDFEEPSVTERGIAENRPSFVFKARRVPYSCIFQLEKPNA